MKSNPYGGGSAPPSNIIHTNSKLTDWERKAIHAVGSVISFWGFKDNHGRIWCLLYLRDVPFTSADIQNLLSLSKGSVSMLLSDLEDWNIILIHKKTKPKTYIANEKLVQMIVHVFQKREKGLLQQTRTLLQEAYDEALLDNAPTSILHRIQLMIKLSKLIDRLLGMISTLSPLNIHTLLQKFLPAS